MKFGVFYEVQLPTPHREGDEGRMFREALELFATEVMPEFVDGEDEREAAKAERLAPAIDAALARKIHLPMPAEIPAVDTYGRFSHLPTADDYAIEGTSAATAGALELRS
jgi:hypothetical protein